MSFEILGLAPWMCQVCRHVGLSTPTPIQKECIPRILRNENRISACAPTGTGKTAAYVLPILQQLSSDMFGVYCIVLSPTRELATQIADQFHLFGTSVGVRVGLLVGGMKQSENLKAVETRAHVLVGTPGRMLYILTCTTYVEVATRYVKFIVLDEADKLLTEPEHARDVVALTKFLLRDRNVADVRFLMFSATLDHSEAWKILLGDDAPAAITCTGGDDDSGNVKEQHVVQIEEGGNLFEQYMLVPNHVKLVHLVTMLSPDTCPWKCVMVFVNSRRRAEIIRLTLQLLGYSVTGMHALQNQQQRKDSLTLFKLGAAKIMVCTDVFARGIDVAGVEVVIHYDFPASAVRYKHRAGRTARGGASGTSIVFVTERDVHVFKTLRQRLHTRFQKRRPENERIILKKLDTVTQAMLEARSITKRLYPQERGGDDDDDGLNVGGGGNDEGNEDGDQEDDNVNDPAEDNHISTANKAVVREVEEESRATSK
eukprot:PhF_6_TR29317/c0_g1_i3/m.43009/K14778/DDX49, DBP8; ATP-dependent RNA helicase DDX49/DBP8